MEEDSAAACGTHWRVLNAGTMRWVPAVDEVELLSDRACTVPIMIPANGGWDTAATDCPSTGCDLCSGWTRGTRTGGTGASPGTGPSGRSTGTVNDTGCQNAIDGSGSLSWRGPQDGPYPPNSAWVAFRFSSPTWAGEYF